MTSKVRAGWRLVLLLGAALGTVACSGGGGGGNNNSGVTTALTIVSCSLGCNAAAGVDQVTCGTTNIPTNQEIRVRFSSSIDPLTLDGNTFQVFDGTGKTPPGAFRLDPTDDSVVIYSPQITFNSSGDPVFGLSSGVTYTLKINGSTLDQNGPYIMSKGGQENRTRLLCTVFADPSLTVVDAVSGQPRQVTTVDVADIASYDPNNFPTNIFRDQPAAGAVDVYRFTDIRIEFDDLMNPEVLANPVTGVSETIRVSVDPDGDPSDSLDQVTVQGTFTITLDQDESPKTTVIFTPSAGLPSSGTSPTVKRKIVVSFSQSITDLGGNSVVNPGDIVFTSEVLPFPVEILEEDFVSTVREDTSRGGSAWAGGTLEKGPGGGSGRLGELLVPAGETVTLNSDFEDFTLIDNTNIFNPENVIDSSVFGMVDPVTDGVFEFSRLRVEVGATLRIEGTLPARVFTRGETVVQGLIDVRGRDASVQRADDFPGGAGGEPGPGGGTGGKGGDRPDGENFIDQGGEDNPDDPGPVDPFNPADYVLLNGQDGEGIPFPDTLNPIGTVGNGIGGLAWPQPSAADLMAHLPVDPLDTLGLNFEKIQLCKNLVPGGAGSGAAYAFSGAFGIAMFGGLSSDPILVPPDSPGGDSADIGIGADVRALNPELGLLRGGAGGGGGGAHVQETRINGAALFDCSLPLPGPPLMIVDYNAHSGAGGGGGGGAIQMQSGKRVVLNGVIDACGGDGGARRFPELAQGGGGGAGGAVLLQAPQLLVQTVPDRILVDGGLGGEGPQGSAGGSGSPGFVRMEAGDQTPDFEVEKTKISPDEDTILAEYGVGIDELLSTEIWPPPTVGPGAKSGVQSCWFAPSGNFFELVFQEDGQELGWDLLLRVAGLPDPQSFRGANDIIGSPLESVLGNDLGSSPVVIRFQGARSQGALADPCNTVQVGVDSPIKAGSVTGWVRHPEELSNFHGDGSLTPNLIRFSVIWDASNPFYSAIEGVDNLSIRVQPD